MIKNRKSREDKENNIKIIKNIKNREDKENNIKII